MRKGKNGLLLPSVAFILFSLPVIFMSSCTTLFKPSLGITQEHKQQEEKEEDINLVWPQPPDPPRIAFVKTIKGAKEVEKVIKRGWFKRILYFIAGLVVGGGHEPPALVRPYGVVSANEHKVYISDTALQLVHLFDFAQRTYSQIFKIKKGSLISPIGVALDKDENLYVADSVMARVYIFDKNGEYIGEIGTSREFLRPTGLAIDKEKGYLFVVDTLANRIMVYNLQNREFLYTFGERGSEDNEGLNLPTHIAVRGNKIYVCDTMNFRVKIYNLDGKFIRQFGRLGDKPGFLAKPKGIAADTYGHIYIVESYYDSIQIFNEYGELLLFFGRSGNKKGEFWLPAGVFIDDNNRIYIADSFNNRVQVFQYIYPE